jgi:hypothetical protein
MSVIKIGYDGEDCILLAKIGFHWQVSVNTALNPRIFCRRVNFSEELIYLDLLKN